MSDYASMKIAELKKELKAKGLPVSGKKEELVERLEAAVNTDLLDENDDDLDQEDEQMTEEAIKDAEKELQEDPDTSLTDQQTDKQTTNITDTENKENTATAEKVKVTSPATADPAEQIKARAERFGGFQSDEAKKAARAARFADMFPAKEAANGEPAKKIGAAPPADLELLKKRADRFGTAVSPVVKEAEVNEAIKRRQERFGLVSKDEPKPKKAILNGGQNSVVLDEKMKARAERFKI